METTTLLTKRENFGQQGRSLVHFEGILSLVKNLDATLYGGNRFEGILKVVPMTVIGNDGVKND